jgi:CBS domain-containing protein
MSLRQFVHPLAIADARETVERAACIMRDRGVGCLLVTSEGLSWLLSSPAARSPGILVKP